MGEDRDTRLRRAALRSGHRGIREMDLILTHFWSREGAGLRGADLDLYERLLDESDHDLLLWIAGARPAPDALRPLLARVAAGAVGIARA